MVPEKVIKGRMDGRWVGSLEGERNIILKNTPRKMVYFFIGPVALKIWGHHLERLDTKKSKIFLTKFLKNTNAILVA